MLLVCSVQAFAMSAAQDVQALLESIGSKGKLHLAASSPAQQVAPLSLGWPELDAALPDGGLPRGVVELTAPGALGGSTSVALAAVRAGQGRAAGAWCAWIDPEGTLNAPGVVAAGVDMARMLVVRAPRAQIGRVAVKVVASGAFEVVVIDVDAINSPVVWGHTGSVSSSKRGWAPEVLVRKLALAAEPSGATVLLLTDASRPRAAPWPVALRLELSRPSRRELAVRVGKDKRGRVGLAKTVPFEPIRRACCE
jgi:recombination protein RecA